MRTYNKIWGASESPLFYDKITSKENLNNRDYLCL